MFQYTLDQITTKSPNNIVPMTLLMINQLVTEEIVHYQGFKCDSIILVAYVLDVAPTVSKRGHFQLIFTLRDASGSATLRCILTSYEDNDFLNNLLRRNRITSLKDFHYVKCVRPRPKLGPPTCEIQQKALP